MKETPRDTGESQSPRPRQARQNGPAIRALREKDGWSQTALAKAAGISQGSLSDIESESENAAVLTLNRIARRLRVPVDAIMRDHMPAAEQDDDEAEEAAEPEGAAAA